MRTCTHTNLTHELAEAALWLRRRALHEHNNAIAVDHLLQSCTLICRQCQCSSAGGKDVRPTVHNRTAKCTLHLCVHKQVSMTINTAINTCADVQRINKFAIVDQISISFIGTRTKNRDQNTRVT